MGFCRVCHNLDVLDKLLVRINAVEHFIKKIIIQYKGLARRIGALPDVVLGPLDQCVDALLRDWINSDPPGVHPEIVEVLEVGVQLLIRRPEHDHEAVRERPLSNALRISLPVE